MKHKISKKEALGIDDRPLIWIGIPVLSFLIPLLLFGGTLANGLLAYLPKWGISFMYTLAYWMACRQIFIHLRRRFPFAYQTTERLLYTGLYLILAFIGINLVLGFICYPIMERYPEQKGDPFDLTVGSFLIVLLVSTIYESIYFYQNWKRTLLEAEQLRREQVESQLEGLRSQVNPHFLFNSLNTLTYLIPEDQQKAVKFVQKLSKVYRYILETRDEKVIPLEEELRFLKSYTFLLQERFADNLQVNIRVPESAKQLKVVPLSMQMLFENAIKHNIISSARPLKIEVTVEQDRLHVRNNLQRKQQVMSSTGLGLENIKNRYRYFTDAPVQVEESKERFEVSMPLLG